MSRRRSPAVRESWRRLRSDSARLRSHWQSCGSPPTSRSFARLRELLRAAEAAYLCSRRRKAVPFVWEGVHLVARVTALGQLRVLDPAGDVLVASDYWRV